MAASAAEKKNSNKITSLAFKLLRENDPAKWEAFKEEAAAQLGVEYKRRKTEAEKAREALADLLQKNPDLRTELFAEIEKQVTGGGTPIPEVPQPA